MAAKKTTAKKMPAKKTAAKKMTPTAGRKTSKRDEPGSGNNIGPLGAGTAGTGRGGASSGGDYNSRAMLKQAEERLSSVQNRIAKLSQKVPSLRASGIKSTTIDAQLADMRKAEVQFRKDVERWKKRSGQ